MLSRNLSRILRFTRLVSPNISQYVSQRGLKVSAITGVKKFQQSETEFIAKFVPSYESAENVECKQTFELQETYEGKSNEELIKDFGSLSHFCRDTGACLSDDAYIGFFRAFNRQVADFTDDQLIQVLTDLARFPPTKKINDNNFYPLWLALDETCCERNVRKWKYQTILRFCNLWYKLHLAKVGKFCGKGVTKICRRVDRLSPSELVETMFYLTVCRIRIPMVDVEARFHEVFDRLTINEVGIMCLAFFKTESKLQLNELVNKIYDKTIKEINTLQDISLTNILKTLRYSSLPPHASKMKEMSDALLPKVKDSSLIACLHMILLGTNLQYCHHELVEKIVKKYLENLKLTRLKDIERIAFVIALYNFKSESGVEMKLLNGILQELKARVDEIVLYPKCLASCAHYLSVYGVYDEEVIRSVLKESFIEFAYGTNMFRVGREILCLDSFTRINLRATYNGPQLSEKKRATITKFQTQYIPFRGQKYRLTHADLIQLDVKEFLERQLGENVLAHILPHYQRADIVHLFNDEGKSVTNEIIECFPDHYNGEILFKENILSKRAEIAAKMDTYKMIAIVVGGWNLFLRDTDVPTGELKMKTEQLEMVGYKPILIHWNTWLKMTLDKKEQFIDEEIQKALSS